MINGIADIPGIKEVRGGSVLLWQINTVIDDAATYINRVEADGGEIMDAAYVNSVYDKLEELELTDYLVHWSSAKAGIKKDGSGLVSKLYSLGAGANDAEQLSGAGMPLYSGGDIIYSGGQSLAIKDSAIVNPSQITLSARFNRNGSQNAAVLAYRDDPNPNQMIQLWNASFNITLQFASQDTSLVSIPHLISNDQFYDVGVSVNRSSNVTNYLVDGVQVATNNTALTGQLTSTKITIGGRINNGLGAFFNGKINNTWVFSKDLTATEIQELNAL